jgi:N-methylhydantoinase B/oxoprolinase/acetone carboxylase alpha subunit
MVREIELLGPATVTILSDRRTFPPYGLKGGEAGKPGLNLFVRGSDTRILPGKVSLDGQAGDRIRIETPGGGGFGPVKPA